MCQVLFWIRLSYLSNRFGDLPIYGFGMMLFVAFVACIWLAVRLSRREGISPEPIKDLALWLFVSGILGARLVYMIQYGVPISQFYAIWQGGLVYYGSFLGGVVGFLIAYRVFLWKHTKHVWKIADIIAPCAALGLCLGRVGCLLNGCCYGNVACPNCPAIHFPLSSPPRYGFTERGLQTAAGFTVKRGSAKSVVSSVEPDSQVARAGLKPGDVILETDGSDTETYDLLVKRLTQSDWQDRGKNDLVLVVRHPDGTKQTLPAAYPKTIGLHPTQIYESISMGLLLLVLLAYYPLKRHDGTVFILFMAAYAVHRFLNEMLRNRYRSRGVRDDPVAERQHLDARGGGILAALYSALADR